MSTSSPFPAGRPLAVVVARGGRPPLGADEAVAEAGGAVLVLGDGAQEAAGALGAARLSWWNDTGPGLRAGALSAAVAGLLADVPLLVLPASPDGRDLAPRLAAATGRPLLAQAIRVSLHGYEVSADLTRLDGRLLVGARCPAPAVATLVPGSRTAEPVTVEAAPQRLELPQLPVVLDVEVLDVLEPLPETMELAEAPRVVGGGAGLVPRLDAAAAGGRDTTARETFALLADVGAALGCSAGATRVVTDAGWLGYDRQIGTTGVTLHPELYIALGVSGASQHTGGLGAPRHVVSINTDPSCPMTAMADLGLVADARSVLIELAGRLGVPVPAALASGPVTTVQEVPGD